MRIWPRPSGAFARPRRKGAQIICVQELFRSQYFCQTEEHRHVRPRRDRSRADHGELREAGARAGRRDRGFGFRAPHGGRVSQHGRGDRCRRRRCSGLYRKMHIPDDPRFYEKYYFTPGDLGFRCFDTQYARIAPLVCWDQWYPEGARLAALGGAQILFYPTAIGLHQSDAGEAGDAAQCLGDHSALARHRQRRLRGRGQSRRPRRSARSDGLQFWGGSFVARSAGPHAGQGGRRRRDAGRGVRPARDRSTCAATGRSCATGGSTRTGRSSTG